MSFNSDQQQYEPYYDLQMISSQIECNKAFQQYSLQGACLNKNCTLDRLYCQICEQDHGQHKNDTFSFIQIQQQFFENPHSNIKYIYEQLDQIKNRIQEETNKFQKESYSVISHYQSCFPQIKNFSYSQMNYYIEKIMANLKNLNSNIIFNDSQEIFQEVKLKFQHILHRFIAQMDKVQSLFNDLINFKKLISEQKQSFQSFEQDLTQISQLNHQKELNCNIISHKHQSNTKIKGLCIFENCKNKSKLICTRSAFEHEDHKVYIIPFFEFYQSSKQFKLDNQQIILISSLQVYSRSEYMKFDQDLQNLLTPRHHVNQIINRIYNEGNQEEVMQQINEMVYVDMNNFQLRFKLENKELFQKQIQVIVKRFCQNLEQFYQMSCKNYEHGQQVQ